MIIITKATKNKSTKQFQHGVRIGFFSAMNREKEPGSPSTLWVKFQTLQFSCCCCSVAQLYLTLCHPIDTAHQASLSFTISWSLLKLMSLESMMPSNHLILCRTFSSCPQILPSGSFLMSQFFTSGSQSIRGLASASVIPMNIQD